MDFRGVNTYYFFNVLEWILEGERGSLSVYNMVYGVYNVEYIIYFFMYTMLCIQYEIWCIQYEMLCIQYTFLCIQYIYVRNLGYFVISCCVKWGTFVKCCRKK